MDFDLTDQFQEDLAAIIETLTVDGVRACPEAVDAVLERDLGISGHPLYEWRLWLTIALIQSEDIAPADIPPEVQSYVHVNQRNPQSPNSFRTFFAPYVPHQHFCRKYYPDEVLHAGVKAARRRLEAKAYSE